MSRRLLVGSAVVALLLLAVVPPAVRAADGLTVAVHPTAITTRLGQKFLFRSTIANRGSAAASGLVAHLNVLSLRPGLYVDPEDWSSHRTRFLAPIPAGGSTTLVWRMSAVNAGKIGVYVAVLSQQGGPMPPVTGPAVQVTIADRKTLNSGGILPLVLGVPALLVALILILRVRRRS